MSLKATTEDEPERAPLALALPRAAPRVLVCHGDAFVAHGIARLLEHALGAEVTLCLDPREEPDPAAPPPEVVVCDSFFADGHPGRFLRDPEDTAALVVATNDSPLSRDLARRGGATAYGVLADGADALVATVRGLLRSEGAPTPAPPNRTRAPDRPTHLTAQESRVLLLLERGLRFKQVAAELSITEATAKGHARALFAKLGAHSRGEAVYEARRLGVLDFLRGGPRPVPVLTDERTPR